MFKLKSSFCINEFSQKTKQSFNTRTISFVCLILYFLVSFILIALVDVKNSWSPINNLNVKFGLAWILIAWNSLIFLFFAIEISTLFFNKNKKFTIFILFLINILSPTILYLLNQYGFFVIPNLQTWFLVCILLSNIVTLSIINFLLKIYKNWSLKNSLFLSILFFFGSSYLVTFFFFAFIKGWTTILILFLIISLTDTFAYLGGITFGKTKLLNKISPNKTIGGFISGIGGSSLVAIILVIGLSFMNNNHNFEPNLLGVIDNPATWWSLTICLLIGLCFAVVLGDLFFSFIKRQFNIKDFSHLIPGHGGVYDRFDSSTIVYSIFFITTLIVNNISNIGLFIN